MNSITKYFVLLTLAFALIGCSNKKQEQHNPENRTYNNLKEGDVIEISGKLICAHCYAFNKENVGIDHQLPKSGFVKDCAITCAKQNYPIAVLLDQPIDSTKLWIIRTAGDTFKDYMTKTLIVKGEYVYRGLIEPTELKVKKGNEWVNLKNKKSSMM